ncbi:MAG TPA: glutamate synthase large subunit [Caldilineae bacterium]|nr:glutamate synthase large subunit [Caldilineae bacterium]
MPLTSPLLHHPRFHKDSCGIGVIADIPGRRSHELVHMAVDALAAMEHRGGVAADSGTGDGAGLLTQIPVRFFGRLLGLPQIKFGDLAVGVFFAPPDLDPEVWQSLVKAELEVLGVPLLSWRPVPVNIYALGSFAARTRPDIWQAFILRPDSLDRNEPFERTLYLARRRIERALAQAQLDIYIPSFSSRTIVYKGLMLGSQVANFYPDLADPDYRSAMILYHQRYATNTAPDWRRAQPFRLLAHNGEINTLQGNINWMRARIERLSREDDFVRAIAPILDETGSDSAMLDNAVEALVRRGRELRHAIMMLTPEAWEHVKDMPPALRAFYRYHAALTEPWDGPAALVFTDGRVAGASLDRNGLRPLRYLRTLDGLLIASSEAGVIPIPAARITRRGKLGPGQMLLVDTHRGRLLLNDEIKEEISGRRPYMTWSHNNFYHIDKLERAIRHRQNFLLDAVGGELAEPVYEEGALLDPEEAAAPDLLPLEQAFGYTAESIGMMLKPMAIAGKEPTGAMGDDTPPAVMSQLPRPLYHYFYQRFAEVTNPPIDPLRERSVMSLQMLLGRRRSIFDETPNHARLIILETPVLDADTLTLLKQLARDRRTHFDDAHDGLPFSLVTIDITFPVAEGEAGLTAGLDRITAEAEEAFRHGHNLILLTDRAVGPDRAPIPALLAVGAVHHHLIRQGLRMDGSILVEAGDVISVHRLAALIGYGANAVHPWLALDTVAHLAAEGRLKGVDDPAAAQANYLKALEMGLLKIMSKMGISTVESYCGAQIFEIIGLDDEVAARCFAGTPSRLGGVGFDKLADDVLYRHHLAYQTSLNKLEHWGQFKYRKKGEVHAFTPAVIDALHRAVRTPNALGENFQQAYAIYREYSRLLQEKPATDLRDLLVIRSDREPIPLDQVEPVEAIVRRFSAAAMSLGALSPEAHEVLAEAMNRLGARSNSGEGGEDPARYNSPRNSAVKQVASGRFGVTPAYLISAQELQIKMAQGSKPGEGGHLPGHKVTDLIASIRLTTPGVPLISPPPHHDIYSIEDLAQLIDDLCQIHPEATISVKLVAQTGVGAIASGVAKGRAHVILISGHDGGTGASPLTSIKHAGAPWELGLAETQQALRAGGLRDRVVVRADGGLRTGLDVMKAALLGADEFSFGTLAMLAEGCIMARVCHRNTCPVGVATQDPKRRAKFQGRVEHVMAAFTFVAQEVRELLAQMGYRCLDEVIGRTDLLIQTPTGNPALDSLDLSPLLAQPEGDSPRHFVQWPDYDAPNALGNRVAETALAALALDQLPLKREFEIRNTDRAVGARLSGRLTQLSYTDLPPGSLHYTFRGSAGQSFGAFLNPGVHFTLIGEANDYVGKGLAGGVIAIRPEEDATYAWPEHFLVGNTCLYGATGGELYVAGRAGERFAVRNSQARAVVEGVGDHGCEYMTGGVVVVLGPTGYNFAAGMTGGQAFVLDDADWPRFLKRLNRELVYATRVEDEAAAILLRSLVEAHHAHTQSPLAEALLADWSRVLPRFWHVRPKWMRERKPTVEAKEAHSRLNASR